MRTIRTYMRIARKQRWRETPWAIDASATPNPRPLTQGAGVTEVQLHTVHFALDIQIPEELLEPANWPTITVRVDELEQLPVEVNAVEEAP